MERNLKTGIASGMSAACYAEFACRVPKAGSAYVYTYLTLGELCAFVIGWNLILEHSLAVAAISRAMIGYIDALTDQAIHSSLPVYFQEHSWDYYSVILILIIAVLVCFGYFISHISFSSVTNSQDKENISRNVTSLKMLKQLKLVKLSHVL